MTTVNFTITDSNSAPIDGALIDISLPSAGINLLTEELVLPTSVKATTNAQGVASVDLPPINTVAYIAVVFDANKNRKGVYEFFVPKNPKNPGDVGYNPNYSVNVADLVLLPKPSGVTYDSAAIAAITNDRILAQQASDDAQNYASPRYKVSAIPFVNVATVQTAFLTEDHNNGFIFVDEDLGSIQVPDDATLDFAIGSNFLFVKGATYPQINVSFVPKNGSVTVEALAITGTKLQYATDVISLVKVAANEWKLFNLSEGASGTAATSFIGVYQQFDDVDLQITALENFRDYMNTQLVSLQTNVNFKTLSISAIDNAIASITSVLANLNATIDQKITEAVPGLGDISASVTAAQLAATNAAASLASAVNSENASSASAIASNISEINAGISEGVIVGLVSGSDYVAANLIELKSFDINFITSCMLEGVTSPGVGQKRYYYSAASMVVSDDIYVVRPNSIVNDTFAGRWLHLPVANDQLIDNTIGINKLVDITGQTFLGRADGAGTGAVTVLSQAQARTSLGLGSNAYDTGYPVQPIGYARIFSGSFPQTFNGIHLPTIFLTTGYIYSVYKVVAESCAITGQQALAIRFTWDSGTSWTSPITLTPGGSPSTANWIDVLSYELSGMNYQRVDGIGYRPGVSGYCSGSGLAPRVQRVDNHVNSTGKPTGFAIRTSVDFSAANCTVYGLAY